MLEAKDAIRIDKVSYGKTPRTYKAYIFKCECGAEIKSQRQHLKKHSGKCIRCAQFNDPFRATYNELIKSCGRRQLDVTISYEDFLEYTKITSCHYCTANIVWHPHTKSNKENVPGSRAYKLDRKNNNLGYHKANCVVCCRRCNEGKSNAFSYEEWYGMTSYLRSA